MKVGIEKINLYAGWAYTDAAMLATRRGKTVAYARDEIMVDRRAVIPVYEDAVTLAINAARELLSTEDRESIDLLIVGTESGVDFGKPISTWVHRFCGLPENCRNFEIKHACYGATAALKMALAWIESHGNPNKKALVISSDITRPKLAEDFDYIGGGCAVAMLVGADPQVLEIDSRETGFWTHEITDTFRPTARDEISDGQTSLYAYLDALEGAYAHFAEAVDIDAYDSYFAKHIYHTPFPGMSLKAHRTLLDILGITDKAAAQASFDATVREGLGIAKRIGTAYGASNFVSLMSLLNSADDLQPGDNISLFAYGSGCQSEFYGARIGPTATQVVQSLELDAYLLRRREVSLDAYEQNEEARAALIDSPGYMPSLEDPGGVYKEFYEGNGLLVLKQVQDFRRVYDWS